MQISGIQKLTLLDYPGKVACTVFTQGCNLRCPFCHNASLVIENTPPALTEDELLAYLKKRVGVLEGVAITGGEPTLNAELPELLGRIKALGYKIKLDTNGTNPRLLREIIEAGLVDRVAMDIKNAPEKYPETAGCAVDMEKINKSKELLLSGVVEYEFRTTVVRGLHTKESLIGAAKWIAGAEEYYLQQFKNSGNLILPEGLSEYTKEEMLKLLNAVREFVPHAELRGIYIGGEQCTR